MKKNQEQSNFKKLYKKLSDSQKSLFAIYRQVSVCLSIPGNQKVCDCIAAFYAEAQEFSTPISTQMPADSALTSKRSEQGEAASAHADTCGGKE